GNVTGVDVLHGFVAAAAMGSPPSSPPLDIELENPASTDAQRSIMVALQHGDDGERPTAAEYEGEEDPNTGLKRGLVQFEDLADISIVAAPGSTFGYANGYRAEAQAITGLLIGHCEKMRYRIAVLDSGDALSISEVRAQRARLDSRHAALYYPWVRVLDPLTQRE